jgi:hypothetical protein
VHKLRRLLPYTPYLGLALLVMGPLLLPGYVLTMDMVFTPVLRLADHVDNTWLMYALLHVLDFVLPADVVQKLVLLSCLLLSGVGMHRLLLALRPEDDRHWQQAIYVAAAFYMVNPFVYDRLMAGQWGVWLGYALLPWFARSLLGLVLTPSGQAALRVGLWLTAMSIVSIHSVGYAMLLIVVAIASQARDWKRLRIFLKYMGISASLFLVASLYWLVPTLLGQGRIASSLATFTASGHQAFATVDAVGTSPLGSVLGLLGFWQEQRDLYVTPIESYALWGFAYLALLGLIVLGAVQAWRRHRDIATWALTAGSLAILLAVGLASELGRLLPFMAGYREPQKFAAVWALVAAYLLAWALTWLLAKFRARLVVLAMTALLVLAYTPVMLWGAFGQLKVTDYPADWYQADRILNEQHSDAKVLVLPWHLYMSYNFTNRRIIASPAHAFYDLSVVTSDDPELPGVTPQTRDTTREAVQERILPAGQGGQPVVERLRGLGIGYVVVNKDQDWASYEYIGSEPGVTVLYDGPNLRLYKLAK